MFSPDAGVPASTSLRNPRRRQRTVSDESLVARQIPKRQRRSGLTSETFKPPYVEPNNGYVNGQWRSERSTPNNSGLAIRNRRLSKSDHDRRELRSNSNVLLTKNENYVVTRLTTTPIQLQENQSTETWQSELAPWAGLAVATTQTQAIVWRYKHDISDAEITKPLIIPLPHPSNGTGQPLPLGILVPTSPEPGLLIVMPVSGKVTYWETLSSAASVDSSRRKQLATEGIVQGLLSGEIIVEITEAEPHGFLLTFGTGRVAHMILTDAQGKPAISVQLLRSNAAHAGGFLSGLKWAFSSAGWRRDVAAVHAGDSWQRGQRQCIIATTRGLFQVWSLNWNGAHSMLYEVDAKQELLDSISKSGDAFPTGLEQFFQVLDFVFLSNTVSGDEKALIKAKTEFKLLALVAFSMRDTSSYYLLTLDLREEGSEVEVVHPISCYRSPLSAESHFKPRLIVPESSQIAFVIFEKSVVLVSLAEVKGTPDSQLQLEAQTLPDPFQDFIDIRRDKPYRIVGCNADLYNKATKESSCTLLIQGYGAINISVLPVKESPSAFDRPRITARTKIEQAIFFGTLPQNLLDFSGRPEVQFDIEDVEDAALEVSHSIMSSSSKYLPQIGPSIEQWLHLRASALAELIKYLRQHYSDLGRVTRWQLLWNAERLAAAKALWTWHSATLQNETRNQINLLAYIVDCIHEDIKTQNDIDGQEPDGVRHWMVHDTWRMEFVVPWAYKVLDVLRTESQEDNEPIPTAEQARLIGEASSLQLAVLETAFEFREANAAFYGLGGERIVDGVLQDGYADLPDPWTSEEIMYVGVEKQAHNAREFVIDYGNNADGEGFPSMEVLEKMAADNPRQVELCCRIYKERLLFLKSKDDPELRKERFELKKQFVQVRKAHLVGLVEVEQAKAGLEIAEKHSDMAALAEIVVDELEAIQDNLKDCEAHGSDFEAEMRLKLAFYKECIDRYFVERGSAWTNAFFPRLIQQKRSGPILDYAQKHQHQVTAFLRSQVEYAKLSWINEILSENDYAKAGHQLGLAQKTEGDLWARKTQLSMSKLAVMAAKSKKQVTEDDGENQIRAIDCQLQGLQAQESLLDFLGPLLRETLNDPAARTQAIMTKYGTRFVKHKPALRHLMEGGFTKIVVGEVLETEELIDILTLMDEDAFNPMDPLEEKFTAERFFLALKLLHSCLPGPIDRPRIELQEMIIWRRCMIQNDWEAINHTELKQDTEIERETGGTSLFKTLKQGLKQGSWSLFSSNTDPTTLTHGTNLTKGLWENVPQLPPSALLHAGTSISSLRDSSRYDDTSDNYLTLLAHDLQIEDDALEQSLNKGRLELWWQGIVEAAKQSVKSDAEQAGEQQSRRLSFENKFRERMDREDEKSRARLEVEDGVATMDTDLQEDVVMEM
ncbi:MAG: hypothetical protein LQ342_003756 [Letrouitia transgressa]|nr:MAG: hypothetical protein LQ342_003756 [Letrouitia transgressa]